MTCWHDRNPDAHRTRSGISRDPLRISKISSTAFCALQRRVQRCHNWPPSTILAGIKSRKTDPDSGSPDHPDFCPRKVPRTRESWASWTIWDPRRPPRSPPPKISISGLPGSSPESGKIIRDLRRNRSWTGTSVIIFFDAEWAFAKTLKITTFYL